MVAEKEVVAVESMAMGSERSKLPLHNFTLPCGLKWGNQKFLRCVRLDSSGQIATVHRRSNRSLEKLIGRRRSEAASGLQRRGSDELVRETDVFKKRQVDSGRKFRADVEDGIAAVREKLIFDLQAETDRMKNAILRKGLKDDEDEERRLVVEEGEERSPAPTTTPKTITPVGPSKTATDAADFARPWNLRTRRSGSKQPNGFAAGSSESNLGLKINVTMPNASPLRSENKSPRLRSSSAAATTIRASSSGEKRERAKFSVALSRQEIEEDFTAIIFHRPPRRPKKRAKYIQRTLDTLFPGLWLTEITPDLYKVPDDQ